VKKKKILLTGGNGFIGKNIQESFLAEKYDILAPRSYELNLIDDICVDEFFKDKKFDVVLHSGCKPGHRNAKDSTQLFASNFRMFENLKRHKDKYKKFINFGSGAIYDNSRNITNAKEEEIGNCIGSDEHCFCKYMVHQQIKELDNFVDLNIFGIFGKYEDWEIRFISNAICKSLFNIPVTLRQNRRFSYLYVKDLMSILEFFIENNVKYKSYNIVPDKSIELAEIVEIVTKISKTAQLASVANSGYGLDYTGDNIRLRDEMPYLSFTNIENSIIELYNYYKENIDIIDIKKLEADK